MKSYKPIPLEKGRYYHIYNRGNNGIDVFFDNDSYYYFYDCIINILIRLVRPLLGVY